MNDSWILPGGVDVEPSSLLTLGLEEEEEEVRCFAVLGLEGGILVWSFFSIWCRFVVFKAFA